MIKEVVGNAINSIESLVLNDLIEHQKQRLGIRQKFFNSLNTLAVQRDQIDLLRDYEELQKEATTEVLDRESVPREKANIAEDEKARVKSLLSSDTTGKTAEEKARMLVDAILGKYREKSENKDK